MKAARLKRHKIVAGLKQAVQVARGKKKPARVRTYAGKLQTSGVLPGTTAGATPAPRSAHTPGPYTTNVARLSDGSINLAHVLGPQGQGLAQVGIYPSEAETLANLNLFAAAPDVLALLANIMIYGIDERDGVIWLRYAGKDICKVTTNSPSGVALLKLEADRRAAIAKATGAQS